MSRRRFAAVVAAGALLASCGVFESASEGGYLDGVGVIPGGDVGSLVTLPEGLEVEFPELLGPVIGPRVSGPRVLMIGDSILASTSRRYGNEMCGALTSLGWKVAVEAEAGSFVDFGQQVMRSRFGEGWDAVVVHLGTNFEGNLASYDDRLRNILEGAWPTPVLLLTTTEFRAAQRTVNEAILAVRGDFDNVTILEWHRISASPGVIGRDRVHLTDGGRAVLAAAVSRALDFPKVSDGGSCLDSRFTDDSRVKGVMPSTTVARGGSDTPDVSTTTDPSSSTTLAPSTTIVSTSTSTSTTSTSSTSTTIPASTSTSSSSSSTSSSSTSSSSTTTTTSTSTTSSTTTTTTAP